MHEYSFATKHQRRLWKQRLLQHETNVQNKNCSTNMQHVKHQCTLFCDSRKTSIQRPRITYATLQLIYQGQPRVVFVYQSCHANIDGSYSVVPLYLSDLQKDHFRPTQNRSHFRGQPCDVVCTHSISPSSHPCLEPSSAELTRKSHTPRTTLAL